MLRTSRLRRAGASPRKLLTRSRTEIARILNLIASTQTSVSAYMESGELLFSTHIRNVDAAAARMVLKYSVSKPANAALFSGGKKKIVLHSENGKLQVRFIAVSPVQILYQGESAIQLEFPEFLLQYEERSHTRFSIPPQMRTKCIVECPGYIAFELDVMDISRSGMGMIMHDASIKLAPGSVLTGCRIKHPLRSPIEVDLQILYTATQRRADGSLRPRVGCRFVGKPEAVAELISMFNRELD